MLFYTVLPQNIIKLKDQFDILGKKYEFSCRGFDEKIDVSVR